MTHYTPRFPFTISKVNTIYPYLFRPKGSLQFQRKRLTLQDGDFLDVDFVQNKNDSIAILCHGLEGSSASKYIIKLSTLLSKNNIDVAAINFRSCGGEMNKAKRLYHSGETEDIHEVISQLEGVYKTIHLVGYSLGGNVVLKYAGENTKKLSNKIRSFQGISVPCDLAGGASEIIKPHNSLYEKRFIKDLSQKAMIKNAQYPGLLDMDALKTIKNLIEFDDKFTAPLHGFKDAEDYYRKSSCKQFLTYISLPTQIISAKDDSFLSDSCYPVDEAKQNAQIQLLTPDYGGHVGFVSFGKEFYWSDKKILEFIQAHN